MEPFAGGLQWLQERAGFTQIKQLNLERRTDSVDFVAAAAAQALGVLGSGAEVVSVLEKAAQSPSWTLRYRANEAFARLNANG